MNLISNWIFLFVRIGKMNKCKNNNNSRYRRSKYNIKTDFFYYIRLIKTKQAVEIVLNKVLCERKECTCFVYDQLI